MLAMRAFFSIVIPTYNREQFIKDAVDSVLNQTDDDLELIVVDDGSTDATAGLLNLMPDERLRVITQDNYGPAHARNRGIDAAQADWICFLDSDDRFLPQKLATIKTAIAVRPDIKIFHTNERWFRNGRELPQKKKHRKPQGTVFERACAICSISISTACVHRSVFDRIGLFDEDYPACEDYEFWLRATACYPVHLIKEVLTEKDGGRPDQLSARIWGLDRFRIKALEKMLRSGTLNKEQTRVCRRHLLDKCRIFLKGANKHNNSAHVDWCQAVIGRYNE